MNWIPISEQNARDLYKVRIFGVIDKNETVHLSLNVSLFQLQECEREKRAYINSTRYGPFHRHAHSFRHSEYYQLHKWIAQIERFVCSSEPKSSIIALLRYFIVSLN